MLVKVKEVPEQKYELSDLTRCSLNWLKRKYELGMVFTAMLSVDSDPRSGRASIILAVQMRNIWNEWHSRMAIRELQGLPALEIWQRIPKADLIKIANRDPAAIGRNIRKRRPLPSDQIVTLNSLDMRASY